MGIHIPVLFDDTTEDLVRAFLLWLHENDWIYVSNSIVGEAAVEAVMRTLKEQVTIKK